MAAAISFHCTIDWSNCFVCALSFPFAFFRLRWSDELFPPFISVAPAIKRHFYGSYFRLLKYHFWGNFFFRSSTSCYTLQLYRNVHCWLCYAKKSRKNYLGNQDYLVLAAQPKINAIKLCQQKKLSPLAARSGYLLHEHLSKYSWTNSRVWR